MALSTASRQALSRTLARSAAIPTARPATRLYASTLPPFSPLATRCIPASLAPKASFAAIARRSFHSSLSRSDKRIPEIDEEATALAGPSPEIPVICERTPIGQVQQRLSITFTCSVDDCGHRSTHEFGKRSYTHGIVIVQCPGCKNRHLIADNLSWFTDSAEEPKTIEEMIAAKGGKVKRGAVTAGGETTEIEG